MQADTGVDRTPVGAHRGVVTELGRLTALKLAQERIDLEVDLESTEAGADLDELAGGFIEVAANSASVMNQLRRLA
jgi:hypothetical protein